MAQKTFFNWSSGKDSALALYHLQQQGEYTVNRLLTTVNSHYDRVSMHGLPRPVLEAQTAAIDIPLDVVEVPEKPSMETYNELMTKKMQQMVSDGYSHAAFGDIFLEDLKVYREKMLATQGIQAVFPIWKRDTRELYMEFLEKGFRTVIVCINNDLMEESFLGTELSLDLLEQFPKNVDPCGENGEFHTFCFDGPIFKEPIVFEIGVKTAREYPNPSGGDPATFWFCDLI